MYLQPYLPIKPLSASRNSVVDPKNQQPRRQVTAKKHLTICKANFTLCKEKLTKDHKMAKLLNHIKQHRARLNLTQQELAKCVDVSRQTIIALEKGQYVPSTLLAFRIAGRLGMKVDELFELEEEGEQ
jgi:putative transcriptional regulator